MIFLSCFAYLIMAIGLMWASLGMASPFMTCDNHVGTNGWVYFDLTIHDDPYCVMVQQYGIGFSDPVLVEACVKPPSPWLTYEGTNTVQGWDMNPGRVSGTLWQDVERPETTRLGFLSSNTNVCPQEVFLHFAFSSYDSWLMDGGVVSRNMAGFKKVEMLLPCEHVPPHTNGVSRITEVVELFDDVQITSYLLANGRLQGIEFKKSTRCTVLLQASDDLETWKDVSYILGFPPSTQWLSSTPLDDFGRFFRLIYFSPIHHPELID